MAAELLHSAHRGARSWSRARSCRLARADRVMTEPTHTAQSGEIGMLLQTGALRTNVHTAGDGPPVVLVHGSGPGVSAWANWRVVVPGLARAHRVIAPDMAGFGSTQVPAGTPLELSTWIEQLLALLDVLGIDQASIVGNSFGGAIALAFASRHPGRVDRMVLMGSVGIEFELTEGLDAVWGYTPSRESMRDLLHSFVSDPSIVTEELVELRYQASVRPGVQEAFETMFPPPRQGAITALATDREEIARLGHPTLVVHGREDRVVPWTVGRELFELLSDAELHVFGGCGHWTQIERGREFVELVSGFLERT